MCRRYVALGSSFSPSKLVFACEQRYIRPASCTTCSVFSTLQFHGTEGQLAAFACQLIKLESPSGVYSSFSPTRSLLNLLSSCILELVGPLPQDRCAIVYTSIHDKHSGSCRIVLPRFAWKTTRSMIINTRWTASLVVFTNDQRFF